MVRKEIQVLRIRGKQDAALPYLLLACCLALPRIAAAQARVGSAAAGEALYKSTCLVCHGEKAEGKLEFKSPALHRQEDWYLMAQLDKFRSGLRGTAPGDTTGIIMRPMAQAIPSEQAVADVAAYISSLSGPVPVPRVAGDAAAGAAQYKMVCIACHGADALGMPALQSPALVGQNDWYIVAQLKKFKASMRGYNAADIAGLQMKGMAATLVDDRAIANVAAYIATLSATP